jgi:hypothetical protein
VKVSKSTRLMTAPKKYGVDADVFRKDHVTITTRLDSWGGVTLSPPR